MIKEEIERSKKTAIARNKMSAPTAFLVKKGILNKNDVTVLDYGCGKGRDVIELNKLGIRTIGYDPNYCDIDLEDVRVNVVICNFVLNVLPVEYEGVILNKLRTFGAGKIYVAVRNDVKLDGLTRTGTYQRRVNLFDFPIINKTNSYKLYEILC